MDRRIALERLDAVRPGSDDLALPDLRRGEEVLDGDPSLAAEFERRQNWDRRIRVAMQDVSVPEGLQERILASLAASDRTVVAGRNRLTRRRLLAAAAGLAASVVAGGVYLTGAMASDPVSVAQIRDEAGQWLAGRTDPAPFQGEFTPVIPRGILRHRLAFREPAVGLLELRVVAWQFQAQGRRPLRGVLAAVPADEVAVLPTAKSLADREYVVDAKTVMWHEGDFVYVCYVDGGIDELLRRLGNGPIA